MKDSTKVFSVTVPGGCHSQGCHGYPQFAQVPSPHPSVGELKNHEQKDLLITIHESCSEGVFFLFCSFVILYRLKAKFLFTCTVDQSRKLQAPRNPKKM